MEIGLTVLCVFLGACVFWQSLRASGYRLQIELLTHRNEALSRIIARQDAKAKREELRPIYSGKADARGAGVPYNINAE